MKAPRLERVFVASLQRNDDVHLFPVRVFKGKGAKRRAWNFVDKRREEDENLWIGSAVNEAMSE